MIIACCEYLKPAEAVSCSRAFETKSAEPAARNSLLHRLRQTPMYFAHRGYACCFGMLLFGQARKQAMQKQAMHCVDGTECLTADGDQS